MESTLYEITCLFFLNRKNMFIVRTTLTSSENKSYHVIQHMDKF
jgi:hypothetical protein